MECRGKNWSAGYLGRRLAICLGQGWLFPAFVSGCRKNGGNCVKMTAENDTPVMESAWSVDHARRMNPTLVTAYLRSGVPALEFVDWKVNETRLGFAETALPINLASSNQHGVHQAAILALAADYTGGIALATLVDGTPIIGVHPQLDDQGATLWAASLSVQYKHPSSLDVTAVAEIEPERHSRIVRRYRQGSTVLEKVTIRFQNPDRKVAVAEAVYFMRQASMLRPSKPGVVPHPLFEHKVTASARLIAGLRDLESRRDDPLVCDSFANVAATDHGALLAQRFVEGSPELLPMVAARTKSADELVQSTQELRQVVLIGAGLDFRPFRLNLGTETTVFEVDFPCMLVERQRILSSMGIEGAFTREAIPMDLRLESMAANLLNSGFDPSLLTVFIYEGTSMYLTAEDNGRILGDVAALIGHRGCKKDCVNVVLGENEGERDETRPKQL